MILMRRCTLISTYVCCLLAASAARSPRALMQLQNVTITDGMGAGISPEGPTCTCPGTANNATDASPLTPPSPPSPLNATLQPSPTGSATPGVPQFAAASSDGSQSSNCGCVEINVPVCAQQKDPFEIKTFMNECLAKCAGWSFLFGGDCGGFATPMLPPPTSPMPAPPLGADCFCIAELSPVCGRVGNGAPTTFFNKCNAECVNATILSEGKCNSF